MLNVNRTDCQTQIAKRLQELKKWQEKQSLQAKERQAPAEQRVFQVQHKNMASVLDRLLPDEPPRHDDEASAGEQAPKAKRPFLKRGEGLKQRFKVDPDSYRLDKLPKYKYANSHAKFGLKAKPSGPAPKKATKKKTDKKPTPTTTTTTTSSTSNIEESRPAPPSPLELAFQRIFFSSQNVYNSTPDVKSSTCSTTTTTMTAMMKKISREGGGDCDEGLGVKPLSALTWHNVLDSQQLLPIQVSDVRGGDDGDPDDDDNTDLFELMERKALEGSIDMNSSCMKQFLKKRPPKEAPDFDEIPVRPALRQSGLAPSVEEVLASDDDEDDDTGSETEEEGDEVEASGEQSGEVSAVAAKSVGDQLEERHRVRFSEENSTIEYSRGDSEEESQAEETNSTMAASSNDVTVTDASIIEEVKKAVFELLQQRANEVGGDVASSEENKENCSQLVKYGNDYKVTSAPDYLQMGTTTYTPAIPVEFEQQAAIMRKRIESLEEQIAIFKQSNAELVKAKQEHELAKAHFQQDLLDAEDRIKDEKIKMEMYLHDERMQLDADRRHMEEKLRMQYNNNKHRKELKVLSDEIQKLRTEQKQKEQDHAQAQARLRVQLKNCEKDRRVLQEKIDELTKENKRLQLQVAQASREANNKTINEIHKNLNHLLQKEDTKSEAVQTSSRRSLSARSQQSIKKTPSSISSAGERHRSDKSSRKSTPSTRSIQSQNTQRYVYDDEEVITESSPRDKEPEEDLCSDEEISLLMQRYSKGDGDHRKETSPSPTRNSKPQSNSNNNKPQSNNNNNEDKPTEGDTFDVQREITNPDGSKDIYYINGNLKKISGDGMMVRMLYFNNDIKESNIHEGTVKYYYAASNIWHTSYLDGLDILEFPNGQKEHRYKNGVVETHFPDQSVKKTDPNDKEKLEEWSYPDGTTMVRLINGNVVVKFANGQTEVRTDKHKRREYPDGTVKFVYHDGSQETRYSNGRVRMKDKHGNLLMDTASSMA